MDRVQFLCGLSHTRIIEVNNGLLASYPGHPFIHFLIHQIVKNLSKLIPNPMIFTFMSKNYVHNLLIAMGGKETLFFYALRLLLLIISIYSGK